MLELIFRGFFEWIYGLILECWEYFSSGLLDIMSLDFSYLERHMPIIPTIKQVMLGVGWALLLGNLVFQAVKSMMAGIGVEGEDPKLLFTRTFVFAFLLVASPQICELCLNMTSTVIELLELPDAVDITLPSDATFVGLSASWLLVIICGIIVMFQSFKLFFEMAERYFILAVLTIMSPLAFGVGGSKNTSDIFTGWCRMYGSMCLLMCMNVVFIKMLLSILSFHPSGVDVLPWMVLVLTVVKVAKKIDGIITRIGLNPAITGDSLGRTFPGALTYMVARSAVSNIVRTAGKNFSQGSQPSGGGKTSAGKTYFHEKAGATAGAGTTTTANGAAGTTVVSGGAVPRQGQYGKSFAGTAYSPHSVPQTKNYFVDSKKDVSSAQSAQTAPQENAVAGTAQNTKSYAPADVVPPVDAVRQAGSQGSSVRKTSVASGVKHGATYVQNAQNGKSETMQNTRSALHNEVRGGRNLTSSVQSTTNHAPQTVSAPQETRPSAPTSTRFSRNTPPSAQTKIPMAVAATSAIRASSGTVNREAPRTAAVPTSAGVAQTASTRRPSAVTPATAKAPPAAATPSPARQETARSTTQKLTDNHSSLQHGSAGTAAPGVKTPQIQPAARTVPNGAKLTPKMTATPEGKKKPSKSSKRKGKKNGRKSK